MNLNGIEKLNSKNESVVQKISKSAVKRLVKEFQFRMESNKSKFSKFSKSKVSNAYSVDQQDFRTFLIEFK